MNAAKCVLMWRFIGEGKKIHWIPRLTTVPENSPWLFGTAACGIAGLLRTAKNDDECRRCLTCRKLEKNHA